jgi:hypothetical protein
MFAVFLCLLTILSFIGMWQFFVVFYAVGEAVTYRSHPWHEYKQIMAPQIAWIRWFIGGFRK